MRGPSAISSRATGFCRLALLIALTTVQRAGAQPPVFAVAPLPQAEQLTASLVDDPATESPFWRDELAQQGITFDLSTTQFYQGVASGGIEREFEYAGRADYYVKIDAGQAGLWEGGALTLHGETRFGDTINLATGSNIPANFAMEFPLSSGTVTALTAIKLSQRIDENLLLFAGKINTLDEFYQPFASGRGVDAFLNMGFTFPVVLSRTVPYSAWAAGAAWLRDSTSVFTFAVYDTFDSPTTTGFQEFFTNGVTLEVLATLPVEVFGLPGHQSLGGSYSTGTYDSLQTTSYYDPVLGPVTVAGEATGSWALYYLADQALYVDPANPQRKWGLFGNVGIADDGPSPVRWSGTIGAGGSSPLASRPGDTFGVGYFQVAYSSPLRNPPPPDVPAGDDRGFEVFYNLAITPRFHLTPDLQVLSPAHRQTVAPNSQPVDTALVVGLRAKLEF